MTVKSLTLVPALGVLFEGLVWNVTLNSSQNHGSEIAMEVIDDAEKAFLNDFIQETPAELSLTVAVSANSCGSWIGGDNTILRPPACFMALLYMKRRQSTTPSALLTVFTGINVYRNMAITNLSFSRDVKNANMLKINIDLSEINFAKSPKKMAQDPKLKANEGVLDRLNQKLTDLEGRKILESTVEKVAARLQSYAGEALDKITAALIS